MFGENQRVVIFITQPLDHEKLKSEWEAIRNEVANSQSMIDDEFERWNHYLFFLVDEKSMLDINLKYKIEHDTISSRKILISQKEYTEDGFETVVKKYIQYAFEPHYFEEMVEFEKNSEVLALLKDR